ncbi:hypothetical protein CANMA_002988 [Candida margitis]|uniref:uncharacterized protein n=1 Tax=Candida margitis TaxID=1775924 RepID=UPI0022266DEA|nr:uncharacterized protein CANMA_002988 [Candida margitis]KAI5967554.1 hypothetical protein CANMA_002988 [Candida margitis]
MESSINLTASKIDLMTLEELRDPNLISRYPPLFRRRQSYVNVHGDSSTRFGRSLTQQQQSRTKLYEATHSSLFNRPQSPPQPQELPERSLDLGQSPSNETAERKPHRRLTTFLKHFSKESKKIERQETLRRSISKPYSQAKEQNGPSQTRHPDVIEPIYVHALYPSRAKRSFKIKKDASLSPEESRNGHSSLLTASEPQHRSRTVQNQIRFPHSPGQQLSSINSLVVPPVGSSQVIGNPTNYSSTIVHPNMRQEQGNSSNRQQVNFIRYDMMNLDNNALSPIIDESEFTSAQVSPTHNNLNEVLIPTSTFFVPTSTDSEESYYSVEGEAPHFATINIASDTREYSYSPQHQRHRQVSSPLYRFSDNQTDRYASPFATQRHPLMRGV